MTTRALLLPGLLAVAAAAGGCVTGASSPLPAERAKGEDCTAAERAASIRRGMDFLLSRQNRDGSWGRFESARPDEIMLGTQATHRAFRAATTALCCMALMKHGETAATREAPAGEALDRGLRYLMTAEPDVRVTGDVFYNTWSHAYVLQCLARALVAPDRAVPKAGMRAAAGRWLNALLRIQGANGGWGYYDFGSAYQTQTGYMATSFTTATALLAVAEARKAGIDVPDTAVRSAVAFLRRLRTADKTYLYGYYAWKRPGVGYNRPKGSLGRAQSCNLALRRFTQDVSDDDLRLGLDRMLEFHHFMEIGRGRPIPHEAWYYTAGYYFYYGHWHAAEVVRELPRAEQGRYWQELADVMVFTQNPDGSWMDFPMYDYHFDYGTALALLTLLPAQEALAPAP
jgi:hypothetical protein